MHGRANFLDVRQHGVRARSGPIGVSYVPRAEDAAAQVGWAVSRRVGNAVARNRLRRRLRASLFELTRHDSLTLRGGLYVVTASPAAVHLSFAHLRGALATALERSWTRAGQIGAVG